MPGTGLHVGTATSLPASEQRDNQEHILFSQFVRKTFHSCVSPAARNDGQNGAVIVTPDEFAGHQRAAADVGPLCRPQVSLFPRVRNDAHWPFAPFAAQANSPSMAESGRKRPSPNAWGSIVRRLVLMRKVGLSSSHTKSVSGEMSPTRRCSTNNTPHPSPLTQSSKGGS